LTPSEYLEFERASEERHEYVAGEVIAMAGASRAHNLIVANLARELGNRLLDGSCELYVNDMRVQASRDKAYFYPDVTIVCGQAVFEGESSDTLLNPRLIIEVLSPSTEAYDRGEKFARYRKLDSLRDYLLVAQDRPSVDRFSRDGEMWSFESAEGLDANLHLPALDVQLDLVEVYRRVEWPAEQAEGGAGERA
jgi:Uma2 family endonuclease